MAYSLIRASSQYLTITSGCFDINSDYTVCADVMFDAVGDATDQPLFFFEANGSSFDKLMMWGGYGFLTLESYTSYGGTGGNGATTLTSGVWYHVAFQRSGADVKLFTNGALDKTITHDAAAAGRTATNSTRIGFDSSNYPNGLRVANVKAWSRALSASEIATESKMRYPVSTKSLYGFWPMVNGSDKTQDWSGAGHTWTANGSPSEVADPPVRLRRPSLVLPVPAAAGGGGIVVPTVVHHRKMQRAQ